MLIKEIQSRLKKLDYSSSDVVGNISNVFSLKQIDVKLSSKRLADKTCYLLGGIENFIFGIFWGCCGYSGDVVD